MCVHAHKLIQCAYINKKRHIHDYVYAQTSVGINIKYCTCACIGPKKSSEVLKDVETQIPCSNPFELCMQGHVGAFVHVSGRSNTSSDDFNRGGAVLRQ